MKQQNQEMCGFHQHKLDSKNSKVKWISESINGNLKKKKLQMLSYKITGSWEHREMICFGPDTLLLSRHNKPAIYWETRTLTRSIILAMNSAQWSSSRERRKSFAVFHMSRTLSWHIALASVFPQRRFSPGSRYMSATHSKSYTFSVVGWT